MSSAKLQIPTTTTRELKLPGSSGGESSAPSAPAQALSKPKPKRKTLKTHLLAGGAAGFVESSICHPLDTIKTRMQLRNTVGGAYNGPLATGRNIVAREGVLALYKGLTAVVGGIVPKMAVRFSSFEQFKLALNAEERGLPAVFMSGILAGITEAVLVVTPVETCKIRLQGQYNSMMDPVEMAQRKYHNVFQAGLTIVKEEGFGALYKGVLPTIMRQASNQGVNFTCYQIFKNKWLEISGKEELAPWQHLMIGGLSGGMGPCANCPLDVVKTRLQKQVVKPGQTPKYTGILQAIPLIAKEEGPKALWKGLSPRLMRIMPGQAITFAVYERVSKLINE